MAIAALPHSTVHLLGSAQALTTPTSLVKELLDNALDAKATFVDILISPNTIDKIEVRDNGHGIPKEDLDALGRRGHTSKLRSFDELKSIGGVSLGFRGEALASAVQLGQVSVTTRTEGDEVATFVKLKAPGGIASQNSASHPVGTKVSVTKFLYNLPVRKQTAEKESAKTLRKIKELLQSYAFARPKVRFGLKVASGGKGSWSFTPRPNDKMKDAASQIIGRDVAAQCVERSLSFSEKSSQVELHKEDEFLEPAQASDPQSSGFDRFIVEAFFLKPKATSIGHGQYISIDSRPVAHDKGTMRKLVSIYKYYAKKAIVEGGEKLNDPFLRLNIKCPVSSYDPNVEPAKDDVIFQNEPLVLDSIEQLFKEVYGAPASPTVTTTLQTLSAKSNDFELLMSRNRTSGELLVPRDHVKSVEGMTVTVPEQADKENVPNSLPTIYDDSTAEPENSGGQKWSVDMSKDYCEDVEDYQRPNRFSQNSRQMQQPVADIHASPGNSMNPWMIAKMTAPLRPRVTVAPLASADPILRSAVSQSTLVHSSLHELREKPAGPRARVTSPSPMTAESDDGLLLGDDSDAFRRRNDFDSARNIFDGPMQRFTRQNSPRKLMGANKPFVAPTRVVDYAIPPDGLRQTTLTGDALRPAPAQLDNTAMKVEEDHNADIEWAMDFEHRKQDATRQRRKKILAARAETQAQAEADDIPAPIIRRRLQTGPGIIRTEEDHAGEAVRSSPHKNRYHAAIADLEASKPLPLSIDAAKPAFKTSLPDGDPRLYLMRRQRSMQPSVHCGPLRPMRAKSTRLPLERIPEAQNMHNITMRFPVHASAVHDSLQTFTIHDIYISRGRQFKGLSMNISEAKLAESRIQAVVEKWMERCPEKRDEPEYKFENLVLVK